MGDGGLIPGNVVPNVRFGRERYEACVIMKFGWLGCGCMKDVLVT